MSIGEHGDVAFAEAAWDVAVAEIGPVGPPARTAFSDTLARLRRLELTPRQAGAVLALVQPRERAAFEMGLGAFQALAATVELGGAVLEARHDDRLVLDGLLAARVAMAEVYHYLAQVAGRADIPDVATPDETAGMVADSRAELERFRARAG